MQDEYTIYVYFILDLHTKEIKIGQSADPQVRIETLSSKAGHPLLLLAVIEDKMPLEQIMHQKFAHLNSHGEWFTATDEIVLFVNSLHVNANQIENGKLTHRAECKLCGKVYIKDNLKSAQYALRAHTGRKHKEHNDPA